MGKSKTYPHRGLVMHLCIRYDNDMHKYWPSVRIEEDGWLTEQIAVTSEPCSSEVEVARQSLIFGKRLVNGYLDLKEPLDFDLKE